MKIYKTFIDRDIEEIAVQGIIDQALIGSLLDELEQTMREGGWDESDVLAIGLCRSDTDFIEITPVAEAEYSVASDRLHGGWRRFLSGASLEKTVSGRAQLYQLIAEYQRRSRVDFERVFDA